MSEEKQPPLIVLSREHATQRHIVHCPRCAHRMSARSECAASAALADHLEHAHTEGVPQ